MARAKAAEEGDAPAKPARRWKFPKELGACADLLGDLKVQRGAIQAQADAIEEQEKALRAHIIETLPKSKAGGVKGARWQVELVRKLIPQVKDWPAFWAWIRKTKSEDVLQRRLTDKAITDRWDRGTEIPGVERFHVVAVSLKKA